MFYGSECGTVDKKIEPSLIVAETIMLGWTSGATRDGMRNGYVRVSLMGEASTVDKTRANGFCREKREIGSCKKLRTVMKMNVEGSRGRGRAGKKAI